jgi:hypothetical protein
MQKKAAMEAEFGLQTRALWPHCPQGTSPKPTLFIKLSACRQCKIERVF